MFRHSFRVFVCFHPCSYQEVEAVQAPQGVTIFQVQSNNLIDNATLSQLETTVNEIRQVGH